MADQVPPGDAPFDLDKLKQLVEMMESHGLTDVHLRRGDEQWRLRRGPREVLHAVPQQYAPAPIQMAAPVAPASAAPAVPAGSAASSAEAGLIDIKSPTVGTFYAAPSPGEPAFVSVGSVVTGETIVCLIEAMKVFNQIPAEVNGTIAAILVKSGDAVEFGQPLFRVRP
ncbi:MAG: acetyl-CoA carboxylase biotin carboxyl carrier protein [Planctomycetes bacterium]|nr:acetyl-CoA carboxylase biotin carboxyl carrier protein [Planctomycetota bacterium]